MNTHKSSLHVLLLGIIVLQPSSIDPMAIHPSSTKSFCLDNEDTTVNLNFVTLNLGKSNKPCLVNYTYL